MTIAELLASLEQEEHLAIASDIGAGLERARIAAQLMTERPDSTQVTVWLSQLTMAIEALSRAREAIQRNG